MEKIISANNLNLPKENWIKPEIEVFSIKENTLNGTSTNTADGIFFDNSSS